MSTAPAIMWFRQDLRTRDNPALNYAYENGKPVIPLFILEDEDAGEWEIGGASRWWLHNSLQVLDDNLNGHLVLKNGRALDILNQIIQESGADTVVWNRCYEPWRVKRDKHIKEKLSQDNIQVHSFNGSLLFEPWNCLKDDGTPYTVFSPFYKYGCLRGNPEPDRPKNRPERLTYGPAVQTTELQDLDLLPDHDWHKKLEPYWTPGENGAQERLNTFLDTALGDYKNGRDRPDQEKTSRLSPHLHWGEISPRDVWHAVSHKMQAKGFEKDGQKYLAELGWREFSYNLLYYFPTLPDKNFKEKFDAFPWEKNDKALQAWEQGRTGFPIVDAGMRQLYEEGYMHNRVRMIVGSFLVKDLRIHWREGEKWFWDTLVDADLASNSASWQWIAGSGADAAPYFRIFNPMLQSKKFDPNGDYIRRYIPELADLETAHLHAPWEAPEEELEKAGIQLGKDYPYPVVDHAQERDKALKAFESLKESA